MLSNENCWLDIPASSDFSIHNLPFGIFSHGENGPGVGVAIGESVIDLRQVVQLGEWDEIVSDKEVFSAPFLNPMIALGKTVTNEIRDSLQAWLCDIASPLHQHQECLIPMSEVTMHMPVEIGDYTDFYSSIEHATNVGKMFRDPSNALLPNWKHLPVGYHGRASSIILSGTPIRRPHGQTMPKGADRPVFTASKRLDFELEMAFIIGKESQLGQQIPTNQSEDYIFGMVLFNDWSARDIQKWEYVPLGPFLGKSFASAISPWVVTMEALDPFRVTGPVQYPQVMPYLQFGGDKNYDINLEVAIQVQDGAETVVSRSNFKYMYWNMVQQLAHHTINGCNVRVGDMMASGTISGKDETSFGSMLELAWAGTRPLTIADGSERVFIEDHDRVIMRGFAQHEDMRVGFGEVSNLVLPANDSNE